MKGLVVVGLLLSVALAAASFAITSDEPDALERVLEDHVGMPPEERPISPWRRALLGAAGTVLVFTIVVGYGGMRRSRRRR